LAGKATMATKDAAQRTPIAEANSQNQERGLRNGFHERRSRKPLKMFWRGRPLKGADAIGPLFQAMIAEFGKPGATFSMKQQSVEGEYAYILWTAETADNVYEMATDTFVVRDGKIVAQSFTGKITPKS
jgi:hypothetical protein